MTLAEKIISVIAPYNCLVCGAEGLVLCGVCEMDAFPALPSRCYRCKQLTKNYAVCPSCQSASRLRRVWVATTYTGTAKTLVGLYKFARVRAARNPIAQSLAETLPFLPHDTIISFVPTATSRLRQRGYDQAELIAREIARVRGLRCERLVTRVSQARQLGATKKQREHQLRDAFIVVRPQICRSKTIVIVDDVVTTGSTLAAVARVLRDAGVAHVDAAVFAQKV